MIDKSNRAPKGIKAFNTVYIIGIIFAIGKLIEYLQWTFLLIRKWDLPDKPFFSKVNLLDNDIYLSVPTYVIFSTAYIIAFGFIILGLYQLSRTTKMLSENKIFQRDISQAFRKAGKSFLVFAFGTFFIDVILLIWANTSSRVVDLLSTELIVFVILGYLMFFLSDVFHEGVAINEENELTI